MPGPQGDPLMTHVEELKSSGLKATLPRIKILEVFQRAQRRHMTAEDVYKALLGEGADIGLATVYRVLMQFEQAGLLSRSNFESGKAVFELNEGQHHDHLVCLTAAASRSSSTPRSSSASAPWPPRAASSCRSTRWRCTRAAPRPTASTALASRRPSRCGGMPQSGAALHRRWWRLMNSW
jgi:Fe2+ or Zn2+ uptake regulation protein